MTGAVRRIGAIVRRSRPRPYTGGAMVRGGIDAVAVVRQGGEEGEHHAVRRWGVRLSREDNVFNVTQYDNDNNDDSGGHHILRFR